MALLAYGQAIAAGGADNEARNRIWQRVWRGCVVAGHPHHLKRSSASWLGTEERNPAASAVRGGTGRLISRKAYYSTSLCSRPAVGRGVSIAGQNSGCVGVESPAGTIGADDDAGARDEARSALLDDGVCCQFSSLDQSHSSA
jgi:hypothetical protein